MENILIVGLGRFGKHMAIKFNEQNCDIMAIDILESRINTAMRYVTNAQIGDATDEHFMASIGVRDFDLCVVAIGDDFQSSLEAAALLKDLGAKYVLARASSDVHAKFLLRNGADRVVYLEKAMAERLAVAYGSSSIFDYIELTQDISIYEIEMPHSWIGKSIIQKNVRSKYHVSILAIKTGDEIQPLPRPEHIFAKGESLMVMGKNDDVKRLLKSN